MICTQSGSLSSAPPVTTISSSRRHQVGDLREAEGNTLETGLAQVERCGVERQPVDRALRMLVPTGAPLAAEE